MGRERKCILCQIVYSSKQDMDEHMRSMLHHRELENLKGRDCGHECQVCRVTMVSLTDYANHISSPVHKQRVETAEQEAAGNDQEEEYFDKELVTRIEARRELIRKEEEAAAKRAREQEEWRRKEEEVRTKQEKQLQQWNTARQYFCRSGASLDWRYPKNSAPMPAWQTQGDWDRGSNAYAGPGPWQNQDIRSNWHNSKQGRSATWHASEPPNVSKWTSGERVSPHSRDDWTNYNNKKSGREAFPPQVQQRGERGPWQNSKGGGSTAGQNNGSRRVYGQSGLLCDPAVMEGQRSIEYPDLIDFTRDQPVPDSFFIQHTSGAPFTPQDESTKDGKQNPNGATLGGAGTEHDRPNGLGPKAFSGNPKIDKVHRWSPYPSLSHKDTNTSERIYKGPPPLPILQTPRNLPAQDCNVDLRPKCDIALDPYASKSSGPKPVPSRAGQQHRAGQQMRPPDPSVEGKDLGSSSRSLSMSKGNNGRRDSQTSIFACGSNSTCQKAAKLEGLETGPSNLDATTAKTHLNLTTASKTQVSRASSPKTQASRASSPSPSTTPRSQLSRTSSQDSDQSMSSRRSSQDLARKFGSKSSTPRPEQDKQLTEMLRRAKETLLDKRTSVDLSAKHRRETKEKEGAKKEKESKSQEMKMKKTVPDSQEMEMDTVSNSQEMQKTREIVLHIDEEQQKQQVEGSEGAKFGAKERPKRDQLSRRVRVTRSTRAETTEERTNRFTKANPAEGRTTRSTRVDPAEERISRSTRVDPAEDRTTRSTRVDPAEDRTTRSTRVDPAEERTSSSTRVDPTEERTSRSTTVDPAEDRISRSTRVDPAEERTSRSTRVDPAEERTSRSTRVDPAEERTSRSTRVDPAEERTSRSTKVDPAEERTSRSTRVNPAEERTSRSTRVDPTGKITSRSTRVDPAEERTSRAVADQMQTLVESGTSPSDNPMSLQSVQVSTSTMESPGGATLSLSARDELEEEKRERERGPVAGGGEEAMQISDGRQGSDSDRCRSSDPNTDLHTSSDPSPGSALATTLSKVSLPPVLKKDLTKHVGSKTKIGSHEPNLNIARRIRNVSGTRRGEVEKESGLKPTLRQLISSSGSRRCVNWDQVYQEVHRKKQEQGKGLPRFGIEMVSFYQEGLSQEEENIPLTEGFQWETLFDFRDSEPAVAPVTPRKRSLSESSVAPDRLANLSYLFGGLTRGQDQTVSEEKSTVDGPGRMRRRSSEEQGSTSLRDVQQPKAEGTPCESRAQRKAKGPLAEEPLRSLVQQKADSMMGDSSSGNEHNDTLGAGKKRRAAGDVTCPDVPSSERKNKRMRVKSKKERLQVDQLLAVSLREEELCRSLQGIDNGLIQARAALQAAYVEVQRLLVVKQQVSMEMSTLRSRRIELLQGMRGDFEMPAPDQPRVKSCEEEMPLEDRPLTDAGAQCPDQPSQRPVPLYLPPCSTPPSLSPGHHTQPQTVSSGVVIKQEPLSPGKVGTETEAQSAESPVHHGPHSTTLEPTPMAPPTDCAQSGQADFGRLAHQSASMEPSEENSLAVGGSAECSPDGVHSVERGVQVTRGDIWDSKPPLALPFNPPSRRSSRTGPPDPVAPPVLPPPLLPQAEVKTVKRVRKLKKKRALRKAQGTDQQPDNSDTELEAEAASSRPARHHRTRRRAAGSSPPQVTTSCSNPNPPGAAEDRREVGVDAPRPPGSPATRPEATGDSDSPLEMVELPQAPPLEVVNIDTSDPEDDNMEVCSLASPPPRPTVPAPDTPVSYSPKNKPQNLACNEVTSTSGMDVSSVTKTCDSDVHLPLSSAKQAKTSSAVSPDVSSEPGEEELLSEGAFKGHQEAVNAMQVHMGLLYTCSGDRTVRAFNLVTRKCVAVFEGHSTKVNCLLVSSGPGLQHRLYSGSSDQTIRCYSLRTKECVDQFSLPDRVLCIHNRWKVLYAGLANGSVVTFSLKTNKQLDVFECHGPRAVSCLATAQEGARKILLVGSYDSTISVRDAKSGLLLRTLEGHSKTVLCMKVVNDLVFSGSSDQLVHAHNIHTGELVRVYKGHSHAVTVVAILGKVMVTACLDKLVRVYELQTHDRLQVYGGHSDMVMCMAIHKSMIYTGCYDGSVQAVKLNLMQNHRCWWHGCSLIFGLLEHLQQHLLQDHASPNTQTFKCRWKNCNELFATRNGSKQGAPKHMLQHTEEECLAELTN
ncbi:zinc finger protein 106 isoform X2 [Esox lucius]|uniref:zinc finger protein 106 isoform X2 n=1 Tax=Esox lucius TaxID=8010 RepID=UPI0014772DF0|nr:zinc finger protein 106 isoform X2 [Esox lucius]